MHKKSQITIYIALGIVILLVLALVIYVAASEGFSMKGFGRNSEVEDYMRVCGEGLTNKGLKLIGKQGGYIAVPPDHFQSPMADIAYAYYGGAARLPAMANIADNLQGYIDANIPQCIDELRDMGYDVTARNPQSAVQFRKEVVVELVYEVVLKQADDEITFSDFTWSIPVDFQAAYAAAAEITDDWKSNPGGIEHDLINHAGPSISVLSYGTTMVFVIEKSNVLEPYFFLLALEK